ncbi:histone methyltransferase DOT1 [Rhodotorula paludigena]|uniref:histone methyltransferase DOT1 n=1 Tax=Rhodotorula paludigena TaxID=86838 RepID=UPI00317E53C2
MFANRRPAPKQAGASAGSARPATATQTTTSTVQQQPRPATLAVPARTTAPSSPLSSLAASSSPPARPVHPARTAPPPTVKRAGAVPVLKTVVKTVTKVAVAPAPVRPFGAAVPGQQQHQPQPRTLNAYKRPADAPPLKEPAAKRAVDERENGKKGKKNGGGSAAPSSKRGASSSDDASGSSKSRRAAKEGPAPLSSDLDPLTPSEAEDDDESDLSSVDEDYFAKTLTREDGAPVCDRDVRARGEGPTDGKSGESLVLENLGAYREHFVDPQNPEGPTAAWAGADIPVVELEYPADGVRERFALLAPKSDDEYNPIEDVLKVILTVLDHYLTPEEALTHFGHQPGGKGFAAFLYNSSRSSSRAGTPSTPAASATPSAGADSSAAVSAHDFALVPSATSLTRELEKARSKRDGPAFLASLARYNAVLARLRADGTIARNVAAMRGVREKVWTKVFHQCYDRAVGPEIEKLREYEAFSDNVYGELLPRFMNEIFEKTHMKPNSVFVDLGSGVGNCVVQAALATGAESYGFENMAHASHLARLQVAEAERRFRMWALGGGAMRVVEADFCESSEVMSVLRRADVVLVNNEVFTATLNERLSWLFLELPATAKIVSLKPFMPDKFKLSSHNANSPAAILNQSLPQRYKAASVSWKMDGGTYYLTRIDRARVERFQLRERERDERRREQARVRKERREGSSSASVGSGAMSRGASRQ